MAKRIFQQEDGTELTAETRRSEFKRLFLAVTKDRGLEESFVFESLGLSKATIQRVEQEADWKNQNRSHTESVARVISDKLLIRLRGIHDAFKEVLKADRQRRRDSVQTYVREIAAEFGAMERIDQHWLITVVPPLECYRPEVADAVVNAVEKGVSFEYRFPSDEARKTAFPRLPRPETPAKSLCNDIGHAERCISNWNGQFGSIPSSYVIVTCLQHRLSQSLKRKLEFERKQKGGADPTLVDSRIENLKEKVKFTLLDWAPVMFNEKLAWFVSNSRNGRFEIWKEIMLHNQRRRNSHIYADDAEWMRVPLELSKEAFETLTAVKVRNNKDKDGPVPWPKSVKGRRK